MLDEVPAAAKVDDPKGDDCGVVVAAGVCPNENANAPDPEAGGPFAIVVVVVTAGLLVVLCTGNENLGVVLVFKLLPVLASIALVVEVDIVLVPFPNTTLLGVSDRKSVV